jgi:hypothetical protein
LVAQDVTLAVAIRDNLRGRLFQFAVYGTVPVEGSLTFNFNGTSVPLAADFPFLSANYTWHWASSAAIDPSATFQDILNWFIQNEQTISEVVTAVAAATA